MYYNSSKQILNNKKQKKCNAMYILVAFFSVIIN